MMSLCDPIINPFIETLDLRFRTHRSGVWQNFKIWEVEDPLSSDVWRFAKYGEYPDATNPVFIQATHTVTMVKDQDVLDLNLNSDNDVSRFQTGKFKIIVAGTFGGFTGVAPGTPAAGTVSSTWFTGTLELVGASRAIITGAWNTLPGENDQYNLIINAAGSALTSSVNLRVKNMTIKGGSFDLTSLKLSNNCDIQASAILIVNDLKNTSSTAFEILIISGLLKLKNASPIVTAKQIQNYGEVEYSFTSSIGVNNGDPEAHAFDHYNNLTLTGALVTMIKSITVRGTLKLVGVLARAGFDLNYQPGSDLEYSGTALQVVTLNEWSNDNCPESVIFNNPNGVDIDDHRFLGEVAFPNLAEKCTIQEGVVIIKPFEISPRIGTGNPASVWVDENNALIIDENELLILTN